MTAVEAKWIPAKHLILGDDPQLRVFAEISVWYQKIEMFRKGEVRCVLQSYQLARHGISRGGKFSVAVSEGQPAASAQAPEVVSNVLEFSWPMERRISRFRP